jgi:hypothetical protein
MFAYKMTSCIYPLGRALAQNMCDTIGALGEEHQLGGSACKRQRQSRPNADQNSTLWDRQLDSTILNH